MENTLEVHNALRGRSAAIAEGWYDVVAAFGFAPYSVAEVQQRMATLTDQVIDLMLSEQFSVEEAWEIGASLAIMHLVEPDILGQSQEFLSNELFRCLSPEQALLLQPRLAALIGAISSGYFRAVRQTILREQEEIRAAFTTAQEQLELTVRQSEARYRTLVESAEEAIFIIDNKGRFRFMNGSAAWQLGGKPPDFVGKTMWDLFPSDVAESQMANVADVLAKRRPRVTESRTILQGKEHWRETSLQPLLEETDMRGTVLGISTDVTERKNAESSLKIYSERLAMLRHIDHAILSAQSPEAIAEAALEHVRQIIPCWGLKLVLYEFEAGTFLVLAGEMEGFSAGSYYPIEDWHMADQMRKGDSVVLSDIQEICDRSPTWRMLRKAGARALLNVPLFAHGELIGAFNVLSDRPDVYDQAHVEVVGEIASSLAIAIQNARLLESERRAREENIRLIEQTKEHARQLERRVKERTRELSALYEVSAVANRHLDIQTILDKSLERALATLRCVAATIHQIDVDGRGLIVSARSVVPGRTGLLTGFDAIGNHLAREIAGSRDTLVIQDLAAHLRDQEGYTIGRLRKFVGVAMSTGGELMGVLSVFRDGAIDFTKEEIALLGSIADHLAGAIENARLRQETAHLAVLDERSRLARELHDSVTQALYSLTLFAEAAQDRAHDWQVDLVQQHLEEIGITAHQALREMRLLLYELRSSSQLDEGLLEALRRRMDSVESRAGVRAHLISEMPHPLPPPLEISLYRIAQEALNNVLKHAEAASVLVNLYEQDGQVVMEISDDGHGFHQDSALSHGGMGLSIMLERAEAFNGNLTITSDPEQGTMIRVVAPVEASTH